MVEIQTMLTEFFDSQEIDAKTRAYLDHMIGFLVKRAKGELLTGAQYIWRKVHAHPEYKADSFITPGMAYDIVSEISRNGGHDDADWPEELLGPKPDFMEEAIQTLN